MTTCPLSLGPRWELTLDGSSTLHKYRANAIRISVDAAAEMPDGATAPTDGTEAFRLTRLEVAVPVSALRSGDEGLDETMHRALDEAHFPEIAFRMTGARWHAETESAQLEISGQLTVAGKTRPMTLDVEVELQAGGYRLRGTKRLKMTDFGISPPSKLFGMLRADDAVLITHDITLQKAPK